MVPAEARAEFERRLHARGLELSGLVPDVGFSEVFAFYRDIRPLGCIPNEHDADMLLYQWGTYDWGSGKYFNLDLTRQFILDGFEEDDDALFQLSLTFLYIPSPLLEALHNGNRWCHSPLELPDFQQFVVLSSAYQAGLKHTAAKVELKYGAAG